MGNGNADRFELVDGPSEAESDDDSSGTDLIDRGEGAGEQYGCVPGCHEDVGADRAALVGIESVRSLLAGEQPDVSRTGIVLTTVSLIVMPVLAHEKRRVGRDLGARSVEADSQQTQACVYLSAVVLAGLSANAVFDWWWTDRSPPSVSWSS